MPLWEKLKLHNQDSHRSFEELCYQIAKELYEPDGFTRLDDSGGGDGVEFYKAWSDGSEWGWQAKFYRPNPRLSVSNRKPSIKDSLKVACRKHPKLVKWFLCTPTSFTPPGEKQSEKDWFDQELSGVVPAGMSVALEHWGESDFEDWLRNPKFTGIREYFFGELELTLDWFRNRFEECLAAIGPKYLPSLHVETTVDKYVHALLVDKEFRESVSRWDSELDEALSEFRQDMNLLRSYVDSLTAEEAPDRAFVGAAEKLGATLVEATAWFKQTNASLLETCLGCGTSCHASDWTDKVIVALGAYLDQLHALRESSRSGTLAGGTGRIQSSQLKGIAWRVNASAYQISGILQAFTDALTCSEQPAMNVFGSASAGKTHFAAHLCDERIRGGLPALLLRGVSFRESSPLTKQLMNTLGVENCSWDVFLGALESAAEAYDTRLPIVIDGINESVVNGSFSPVWKSDLPGLIVQVKRHPRLALITTYRDTYRPAIWSEGCQQAEVEICGFGPDDMDQAAQKYFDYYKIRVDLAGPLPEEFRHPMYLRIYCEATNFDRQTKKSVQLTAHSLYVVFDKYVHDCAERVSGRLGQHPSVDVLTQVLDQVAESMWNSRNREISLNRVVELADSATLSRLGNWDRTRTKAILDEGLLVSRDWGPQGGVVHFSYDLMAGYFIAKNLLRRFEQDLPGFLKLDSTNELLFSNDFQKGHPLATDIARCLTALLMMKTRTFLFEYSPHPRACRVSVEALFEVPSAAVPPGSDELIAKLFATKDQRDELLDLALPVMLSHDHLLNFRLWSRLLTSLTVAERDISWTEHVRKNTKRYAHFIGDFEKHCRGGVPESDESRRDLNLSAELAMWLLTSTVRPLRDMATKALYWYGRRQPRELVDMVIGSLTVNDCYVSERMLAALYGVAMAQYNDSSVAELALLGCARKLYELMFRPGAPHSTTHVLARDYARRTIDLAILRDPSLLTVEERRRIAPPFPDGGMRAWGRRAFEERYPPPLRMDFCTYTLSGLSGDPPRSSLREVQERVLWRVYQLGYSPVAFDEADRAISQTDFQPGIRGIPEGSIDRYGKKYSWIAYYELLGLELDRSLRDESVEGLRVSHIDMDPSFPEPVQGQCVEIGDLLGDRSPAVHDWVERGPDPNIRGFLTLGELQGESGPWVMLDGLITQGDPVARRSCFVWSRGLFIACDGLDEVRESLNRMDINATRMPDVPRSYCTYAGEVPWCNTFLREETASFEIVLLPKGSARRERRGTRKATGSLAQSKQHRAELPVHYVQREYDRSFFSAVNPEFEVLLPSKKIAQCFDLCSRPQTFDLYEQSGRRASVTTRLGNHWTGGQDIVYLRQELLDAYLKRNHLALVYVIWGERKFTTSDESERAKYCSKHSPWRSFKSVEVYIPLESV